MGVVVLFELPYLRCAHVSTCLSVLGHVCLTHSVRWHINDACMGLGVPHQVYPPCL